MPRLLCNMIRGWEFKPEMEGLVEGGGGCVSGAPANSGGAEEGDVAGELWFLKQRGSRWEQWELSPRLAPSCVQAG